MSANNTNLCTAAEAKFAGDSITAENIGGGTKRIYDNQDPKAAGGLGSPFPPAVDPADLDAKMFMLELKNGAKLNACMAYQTITSKINGPGVWKQMLTIDAKENAPKSE